jgi:hypothetical protein
VAGLPAPAAGVSGLTDCLGPAIMSLILGGCRFLGQGKKVGAEL